jgi:hypothetical protein
MSRWLCWRAGDHAILAPIESAEGNYGRYRIRRVEELTGRDLSSARDRIDFWPALRGRGLVA